MKSIKYILLFISVLLLNHTLLHAQSLKQEVLNFMKDYEKYSSFTNDGLSYEKDYENKFRSLFVGTGSKENLVFNDIEKDNKPPYISIREYIKDVRGDYPKGINVEVNVIKIGEQKVANRNRIEFEIEVKKNMFGLNKDDKIVKSDYELIFLLSYIQSKEEGDRIQIIEITAKGYPREPKGLFIGLNTSLGFANIGTKDFLNEKNTYGAWEQNGKFVINGGLEINYYFKNELLGLGARLNYASYKANFTMDKLEQEQIELTDVDDDLYQLIANGDSINEIIKLSYFEIPLFLKLRFVTQKIKILSQVYINIGPVFSINTSKKIETSGNFIYEGYYPEYHVVLSGIQEYGFENNKGFSTEPESELKSFNLAGLVEVGLNIPLIGEKLNMNIALSYQKGLANLSSKNEDYIFTWYPDKNNPLIDSRAKVSTSFFGLNIGIVYKVF